jgi:hypothetical protein
MKKTYVKTNEIGKFQDIDLGSGPPTSLPMEKVEVVISAENLLGDYARGFIKRCRERHPLRAESLGITEEEVMKYCEFLLQRRVAFVDGSITDSRKLKVLAIPAFIQYCLENVGLVRLIDKGLTLVPVFKGKVITLDEAIVISEKIASFETITAVVFDAMPRDQYGNQEVMSMALIAGYVRGMEKVSPVHSYISAFLGLKLAKENVYSCLYRVVYDDVEFIRSALTRQEVLY